MSRLHAYLRLTRFDRPIGIFLLLWPTFWAVWIAGAGHPSLKIILIFFFGVVLMRAAGCVINDFADRKLDKHVSRTKNRPLTTGEIKTKHAILLAVLLCLMAFVLVLQLNFLTIALACVALALSTLYPFLKRYTHLPQFMLGIAWYIGLLMAFTAQQHTLPPVAWLLYLSVILWTVAYDTMYAMVDREDDLKIGIKSTAILFGHLDRFWIGVLQLVVLILLLLVGQMINAHWVYSISVALAGLLFVYQQYLIRHREPKNCLKAFLNNNYVGLVIFLGILINYL